MKKIQIILCISIIPFIIACEPETIPVTTFDAPFPKKNYDLTNILGNQISIKSFLDTLCLNIYANKDKNLITNKITGDTLFDGKVCKYRGLYYFNEKLNDSSYWIYAVKIDDSLIYGLNTAWFQYILIDSIIGTGNNKKLVKFINSDTSLIRLHPEKHEMKKLFNHIIDLFLPDTILYPEVKLSENIEDGSILPEIDPEEFNYFKKVLPNPTRDAINIELQQKNKYFFQLTDLRGKTILKGQLNEIKNRIDLSKNRAGIYLLTISNMADKQQETIKIAKMD